MGTGATGINTSNKVYSTHGMSSLNYCYSLLQGYLKSKMSTVTPDSSMLVGSFLKDEYEEVK